MAKKSFLKNSKQIKDSIGTTVAAAGVRGVSFMGSAALANKVVPNIPVIGAKIPVKAYGPAFFTLGLLGEAFISDDQPLAQAAAQGMTTFGMVKSVASFLPDDKKEMLGLRGLADDPKPVSNTAKFDWNELLNKSESDVKALPAETVAGPDIEESVSGLGQAQKVDLTNMI